MFKESFAPQPPLKKEIKKVERRDFRAEKNERLDARLKEMAQKINLDLQNYIPPYRQFSKQIVNEDCSINMRAFSKGREAGPYSKKDSQDNIKSIKDDEDFIRARYIDWGELDNESVQAFYKSEHQCQNMDEMVNTFAANKDKENSSMLEKALTILLHRALGNDFIIVRSAKYDDFANGVDNLIINKKTGETICSFDGLNEEFDNKRRDAKLEKVIEKSNKGGAKIKYGLKIENNEIQKKPLYNLPIFYLSLNKVELNDLLNNLRNDLESPLSNQEEVIFKKLLNNFSEQINLLKTENLPKVMIEKLGTFERTLNSLK